ncbi:MAG TPA: hypothetical protein VJA21_32175 [Verrucomicrobiae bacterium]
MTSISQFGNAFHVSSDPADADPMDSRLPLETDRLFMESSWAFDSPISCDPKERFYRMPKGYKRAGDLLLAQGDGDVVDRRNIVYAALFCYRQAIELFLKHLIDKFATEDSNKSLKTHSLQLLWEQFALIAKAHDLEAAEGYAGAAKLVQEMHAADQQSDAFRYPVTKEGNAFAFGDCGVDSVNLRIVMHGLANFFECVDLHISASRDVWP